MRTGRTGDELSPEREDLLKAQAEARGLNVQEWLLQLADDPLAEGYPNQMFVPFWKTFINASEYEKSSAPDHLLTK